MPKRRSPQGSPQLDKTNKLEAALVAIDPRTGEVLALVGRPRFSQQLVQSRNAGEAAAGLRVQAAPLRRGDRAGIHAKLAGDRDGHAYSYRAGRLASVGRARGRELHAAPGADGVEQSRCRESDAARRHHDDADVRAPSGHQLAVARRCPRSRWARAKSRCSISRRRTARSRTAASSRRTR